jgi:alkyl sulfatase BDS1-like metallo-beta-lactamase superfamily hydrolase
MADTDHVITHTTRAAPATQHRSHPDSFHHDDSMTVVASNGGLIHRTSAAHGQRFERKLWKVRDGVWCLVGNGLSNQTFVEGPEGLIAIDTGECNEEMQYALDAVTAETDTPVVAVIYTHFHYVGGTQAIVDSAQTGEGREIPIWSHAGVVGNRRRQGSEVGPVSRAGLIHQFGITLPAEGPDALVNVGLGLGFRNAEHAPFTEGFVEPTNTFATPTTAMIAGLQVDFTPAPSDADDSVTIWFPELSLCVNNIVWPVLFNVFPIRGEEYRDPRGLLNGLDHIIELGAEHLVGAHGPPLNDAADIEREVTRSRDAIQFMWDQTVRGINKGMTLGELTEAVQLPSLYAESYLQAQLYGVVEHHVRQIHAGLRGWFDGDEATLFPVPPAERATKMIAGFGGAEGVRTQVDAALADDDVRWAIEMAMWLVRAPDADQATSDADRARLADGLRIIARRTTAANVRNWCLVRARHLDGTESTDRFHAHRFSVGQVMAAPVGDTLATLRVMLDPTKCNDINLHLTVEADGDRAGLHVRHGVAVPTSGRPDGLSVSLPKQAWAALIAGKSTLSEVLASADVASSDAAAVIEFLRWFEHRSFHV